MAKRFTSLAVLAVLIVLMQAASVMSAAPKKKPAPVKASKEGPCKKYEMILTKLETCPDSGVTFKDFNLTLSDDCRVVPSGCVMVKPFNTATITWNITTTARLAKGREMTGEADACTQLEKIPENALAIMESMKLSTNCPMEASETCANSTTAIDMKKYKDFLWLATGVTTGDVHVEYNIGFACVKFEVMMRNKNGRVQKSPKEIADAKKTIIKMQGKKP